MKVIIDFYNGLETLDLIIFWGIIIVIILLLVFSLIMINKNRKLKNIVKKNNQANEAKNKFEEIPIKKDKDNIQELTEKNQSLKEKSNSNNIQEELATIDLPEIPEIPKEQISNQENSSTSIQTEKKFIAEEHVMEYNKDLFSLSNIKKTNESTEEQSINNPLKSKTTIDLPTGPYQRNVLREMSLSQTSPIGLTTQKKKEDKKIELAKDLEESLNTESNENDLVKEEIKLKEIQKQKELFKEDIKTPNISQPIKKENIEINEDLPKTVNNQYVSKQEENLKHPENRNYQKENNIMKKELSSIENQSPRRTEIRNDNLQRNHLDYEEQKKEATSINRVNQESKKYERETRKELPSQEQQKELSKTIKIYYEPKREEKTIKKEEATEQEKEYNIDPRVKELLNSVSREIKPEKEKSSSEKYLEEVSRKLAEAEISDEIERTDYELEQEENAIISYKELMEKKDSIQTIDEEEAVISIEELMNRSNQKQEPTETKEDTKLYKLTEEEENDDFIKELKQFRNDL